MNTPGYAGRLLYVDLTSGKIRTEPLLTELIDQFIGGFGICAKLAYDLIPPGVDPLSPNNPIIIGTGVFNGTLAPGTPKVFVMTKCAATGTINHGVGSGHFGAMLKWAGYDYVIITGKADKPVYLKIMDDDVELCDAKDLWGRDLVETNKILKGKYGANCSTLCMGISGENLVKISITLTDGYITWGRALGANMGSKNLKGIVVKGSRGIKVADTVRFMNKVDQLVEQGMKDPLRDKWRELNLFFILPMWLKAGHLVCKHGDESLSVEKTMEVYGPDRFKEIKTYSLSCTSCVACDKAVVQIASEECGDFTLALSTSLALTELMKYGIEDMEQSVKFCDAMNRYGLEWATFGGLYDFVVDLYSRGILTKDDTGGIELKFGDFDTLMRVIEMTATRDGIGDILAEGFFGAVERIGRGAEQYAHHIKGIYPDFDARVSVGVESVGSVTSPRPSYDMPVGGLMIGMGRKPEFFRKVTRGMGFPEEVRDRIFADQGLNLGPFLAHYENWATVLNLLGICFRMQCSSLYNDQVVAELYSAATGIEKTSQEIVQCAERSYNIYKAANVREGFTRKDDQFPERWFKPLKHGGEELVLRDYLTGKPLEREDVNKMLDSYYEERGWDIEKGIPTREKLLDLGLDKVADDMQKYL